MKPKILKTEKEYTQALGLVETLMDAAPGSAEEQELELWSLLVERYEQEHFPIDLPDPVDAIRFRMEQEGLRQKDLEKFSPGQEPRLRSAQPQTPPQPRHDPLAPSRIGDTRGSPPPRSADLMWG